MKQNPNDDAINQGDAAAANEGVPGINLHRNDSGFSTGIPPFRKGGPETSRDAAISMIDAARVQREKVLIFIARAGEHGVTADEVTVATGMAPNSVTPRMRELAIACRIVKAGGKRPTRTGRSAFVWVVPSSPTPHGDETKGDGGHD